MREEAPPTLNAAPRAQVSDRRAVWRFVLAFVVFGIVWWSGTVWWGNAQSIEAGKRAIGEWLRGLVFVGVSAGVMGVALDRCLRRLRAEAQEFETREARWRELSDNLPIGYVCRYARDAQGVLKFSLISGGVEQVHGVTPMEVCENPARLWAGWDGAELARLADLERESARTGQDFECDFHVRHRAGQSRTIQWRCRPVQREGGATQWIGFVLDVTEHRGVQASLQERESHFRQLFDYSPSGILVLETASARFLAANPAAVKLFGARTPQDLVGLAFWELSQQRQPDGASSIETAQWHIARAVEEGYDAFEWTHRSLMGREFEASVQLVRVNQGTRVVLQATVRDITESKLAQTALQDSERLLRLALQVGKIGAFELDLASRNAVWSPEVEEIWGLPSGFTGDFQKFCWEHVHPDDLERVVGFYQAFLQEGDENETEMRVLRADGSVRWLRWRARLMRDTAGGGLRVVGVNLDITERKQAEGALQASEERFHAYVEQATDALFVHDLQGRFLEVNRQACVSLGYAREELLAKHVSDVVPDWNEKSALALWQSKAINESTALQSRHRRKDGRIFPVEVHLSCLEVRGERRFLALARDVTERQRAEELLRQSENRFRGLIENAPDGVVLLNQQGVLTYASPAACRMFGLQQDKVEALDPAAATHPEDRARVIGALQELLGNPQQTKTLEYRFRHTDGSWLWIESTFTNLLSVAGVDAIVINFRLIHDRKLAEEALAIEATRRRILIEESRDGIVILNQQGGVHEANRRFAEMLGYSMEEVKRLSVWDWDCDWTRERVLEAIRQVGPSGAHFSARHRRKDGTLFDVELSNNGAEVAGQKLVFCVCRDITERRRAEQRAARDAVRTEFLLELHQCAPLLSDRELHHYLLRRALQLTESTTGIFLLVSKDQNTILRTIWFQGAPVDTATDDDTSYPTAEAGQWVDCIRLQQPLVENRETQLPDRFGLLVRHVRLSRLMSIPVVQDGRVGIVVGVGNKTTDYDPDDVAQLQVVANEMQKIIAQQAAQNQLRESEERFRHLVETTYDWIWQIDAGARYTFASPKVLDLLGYTPAEVLGCTPFELMSAEEAQRVRPMFLQAVSSRSAFSGWEITKKHKTGREVVLEASGVPVLDRQGGLLGYRGMARDVTERKRLEAQFREAQKLEAIGQLAGGVAHDFNNILAAIMMHLGLLRMNTALDGTTQEAIKDLDAEAKRAAALTRQLLMFSRRSVLAIKPLDLNEVIANLLKMLTRLIGENIQLRFDGGSLLPAVEADSGMLEQVVLNLVVNARDAMPKGGRVTLSTSLQEVAGQEDGVRPQRRSGRFVRLSVSDTGKGMDEGTVKRIFEPFFTTKEAGKGTGLGLATVHGIVAQHQGWVEVETELGRGSTFLVYLPAAAPGSAVAVEEPKAEPMPRGQETILLVEDETKVRQMVGRTLRILGYRVFEAANGQEAMALWQGHGTEVDLLFTDMVMPEGMTGLELAERLRELKPGLKAIISSGYSAEMVQAGIPKSAEIIYLPKPFTAETLAAVVRNCLEPR